mgnify:CR=1 FL=1
MKITQSRLNKLSDISISIGQVFFASVFIGPIVSGEYNLIQMFVGLILTIISLFVSILLIKN